MLLSPEYLQQRAEREAALKDLVDWPKDCELTQLRKVETIDTAPCHGPGSPNKGLMGNRDVGEYDQLSSRTVNRDFPPLNSSHAKRALPASTFVIVASGPGAWHDQFLQCPGDFGEERFFRYCPVNFDPQLQPDEAKEWHFHWKSRVGAAMLEAYNSGAQRVMLVCMRDNSRYHPWSMQERDELSELTVPAEAWGRFRFVWCHSRALYKFLTQKEDDWDALWEGRSIGAHGKAAW